MISCQKKSMNQHSGKKRANDDYSDRRIDTLNQLLLSVDMAGPGRTVCPVGVFTVGSKPPGFNGGGREANPSGFSGGLTGSKPGGLNEGGAGVNPSRFSGGLTGSKPGGLNGGGAGVNPG